MEIYKRCLTVIVCTCAFALDVFGAIVIDSFVVEDAGNTADDNGYGSVGYAYEMTNEITIDSYVGFLNKAALNADPYGLYHDKMGTDLGIEKKDGKYVYQGNGYHPIRYVSFNDAARMANYLSTGDTENGCYNFGSGGVVERDVKNFEKGYIALPSLNELHKASFYKGGGTDAGYWDYPNQSNSISTKNANYSSGSVVNVDAGSDPGPYGHYHLAGNLWEWADTKHSSGKDFVRRYRMGGAYSDTNTAWMHRNTSRRAYLDSRQNRTIGFRFVWMSGSVPEPAAYTSILSSLALAIAIMRRKRRRCL